MEIKSSYFLGLSVEKDHLSVKATSISHWWDFDFKFYSNFNFYVYKIQAIGEVYKRFILYVAPNVKQIIAWRQCGFQ